ncbi:hypothetical protein TWF192_004747 [Orbilia oligospora]|nr:hypothetical protein TWF192_004747 [Orbilia oligospora]
MVAFKISAGLALSILMNTGEVSAHARLYNNYGDYDQSKLGGSLAHAYDIPVIDHGDHQHPGQWDVKVSYMPQGCGADLHFIFAYNMAHRRNEINPSNLQNDHVTLWKHRNYHFFMAPIPQGALVNTKQQIDYNAKHGRIAQVTPGGWLDIRVMYPKPPATPPKPIYVDVKKPEPEPKPVYGYAGYDVGAGNYKEGAYGKKVKRDIEGKKIRRAANAETDTQSEDTELKA